jgi:hypothetical protein
MYDNVIYIGIWKDPDLWSINNRLQNVNLSGAAPFWNAHEWTAAGSPISKKFGSSDSREAGEPIDSKS